MSIAKQSCRLYIYIYGTKYIYEIYIYTVCAHAGSSRRVVVPDDHQIDSIVSIIIVISVFVAIMVIIFVIGKSAYVSPASLPSTYSSVSCGVAFFFK